MSQSKRPLSPHLQIYKPQLTSVLSILHRLTGAALSAGLLLVVWWLLAALCGPESYARMQQCLNSDIGRIVLLGWSWALFYHLCNGIRHLFWDAGYGFELKNAYRSGWLVVLASIALTVAAWYPLVREVL